MQMKSNKYNKLVNKITGIVVLLFVGRLLSGSMVGLMVPSSRGLNYMQHDPGLLQSEPLSPWQATADPCFCRRHSNTQRRLVQSLSCIWFPVHTRFCLSPPSISGRYGTKCDFTPPYLVRTFPLPLDVDLYAEYIMRNAELEEAQAGIKIARRNINNLRHADDTTLMAESEEELKSLLNVKEESEKVGLKFNI